MAIGAHPWRMKQAGVDTKTVLRRRRRRDAGRAGRDGEGDLEVTVFQDAAGQGKGAVDAALKLARRQGATATSDIPFQLVTKANYMTFMNKN